jgi:hypothetical protein
MAYLSNVDVFYSLVEDSYSAMGLAMERGRTPKPDGSGFIVSIDSYETAFKNACVVVAFSGMFLEALVYLVALRRFSKSKAQEIDRIKPYRERLEAMGITDSRLLDQAELFQKARRELVHEKALELGKPIANPPIYAQDAAEQAIEFIRSLREQLVAP